MTGTAGAGNQASKQHLLLFRKFNVLFCLAAKCIFIQPATLMPVSSGRTTARKPDFMAFCNLPAGQVASLILIIGSRFTSAAPDLVRNLIENKDWYTLASILSFVTRKDIVVPSEADLAAVGNMAPGLRNAYFVLAIADASATEDGKAYLLQALGTHCWDRVAATLVEAMASTGLTFTGADLKQAYAPNDDAPCIFPDDSDQPLSGAIQDGQVIDGFVSATLRECFEHDFANFFTGTMPVSFTDQLAEFGVIFRDRCKDGLVQVGDAVRNAVNTVGEKLSPAPP